MLALISICLVLGVLGGLVLLFVAFPYRGRALPVVEPLGDAVAAVADRIDPGEAPPQGVLGSPEAARRTRRRIERAESRVTSRLRELSRSVTGASQHEAPVESGRGAPERARRSVPAEIDLRQRLDPAAPRHTRH